VMDSASGQDGKWSVRVFAYDITGGLARQMSAQLIGQHIDALWHTCVCVYGEEFYYGGGVLSDPVGTTRWGVPQRINYIGETEIPREVFETFLDEIRPRYTMATYDITDNNCNAFSEEVCQFLTGKSIPEDIKNMISTISASPMAQLLLPFVRQMQHQITGNYLDTQGYQQPAIATQTSEWDCLRCTFRNQFGYRCEVCGSSKS